MDTGELSEANRRGRRAFVLSLVWPVLFMMSWLNLPIVGAFSTAYARLLSFTIGIACSIVAISVAREVQRSERMMCRSRQRLGLRECRAAWLLGLTVREHRRLEAGERGLIQAEVWERMIEVFGCLPRA
jgi:hypothetical protein